MSDLYTSLMEKVMPILQEHWQLFIMSVGLLFVLGGIFNWKWAWNPDGHRPLGFNAWVYRTFGEKGARINTIIIGIVIMLCCGVMWVLM